MILGGFAAWGLALTSVVLAQDPQTSQAGQTNSSDADARTVAATVQSFYDQTRTIQADFYQTHVNKLYNRTERSRGRVTFSKPGKMRWVYAQPAGNVIVGNGRRITVYEKEANQYFEQQMSDSQLPQALSFLTGTGRLEQDFTFRLLNAQQHGFAQGKVLELRPRSPSPHYERILFYVDAGRARGVVHRVLIIDHAGNRNRFDFSNFQFNRPVPDSEFQWTAPANAHRIER